MMYDLEMMKQFYVSYNGKVQDTRKKLGSFMFHITVKYRIHEKN